MRETTTRALSGIIYIIILISATMYSKLSFNLLFLFFLIVSIYEFCNLLDLNKVVSWIIGLVIYNLFVVIETTTYNQILLLCGSLFVCIRLLVSLFQNKFVKFDVLSKYVLLIGYIILPFVILIKIPYLNAIFYPKIIISIFILIWVNDTFAYIVGKSIGKNKLFESISPKKTIEGFFGGLVFACIGSLLIAKYFVPMTLLFWPTIAIIVGIFGTIGDLVESRFKRLAGVKDSGSIMPGHGGILDRLDSVIFVAPFIYLYLQIIQIL